MHLTALLRRAAAFVLLLAVAAAPALAQSSPTTPLGRWKTIDDETGEAKSIVHIYEKDGKLYGDVEEILRDTEGETPTCDKCQGERKDQPIQGMNILWDLEPKGDQWAGGRILDPEKGKTYRAKVWLDEGMLMVRGYVGPFYRTQTWYPAEES